MLGSTAHKLAAALDSTWLATARPNQLPPPGDWTVWLLLAGRGFGKTRAGAEAVCQRVATGTAKRIAIVGATAADVRDISIEGASGIMACAPDWCRPEYEPSKRRLTWPNGAIATVFSSEEPERARGPEHDFMWADELAAWRFPDEMWAQLMLGLRVGRTPQCIVTTTPKPTRLIKSLVAREGNDVVVTRGSTYDNRDNLAKAFFDTIASRYEGTRLGRQELNAELLEDTPGALWQLSWIDRDRVERAPELSRVVVAIDPAVSTNEGSDETGVIVAGIGKDQHAYVLDDLSGKYQPHEWAAKAIEAYRRHKADRIIAEKNQGGDMVESTIRVQDAKVAFKAVHASRGKVTRAEPIAALYEQRRVHHVGTFPVLEDECCGFTSDFDRARAGYSPDRVDALVWALTELMLGASSQPLLGHGGGAVYTSDPNPELCPTHGGYRGNSGDPTRSQGGIRNPYRNY